MATANETLAIAASQIGYSRWNDPEKGTKYGRWYANLVGDSYFASNGVPFCAMGASWTFNQAGVTCAGFPGAYTPTMLQAAKNAGAVISNKKNAQPGDIAYFNWDGGVVDHVGFIEIPYANYAQTIEFNTGNGQVMRRTRDWSTIEAVVRPNYSAAPAPKPEEPSTPSTPQKRRRRKMECIFQPNDEDFLVYYDGVNLHQLHHPHELYAIRMLYEACTGGETIPQFKFGTKDAPWAWRLQEAVNRGWK